MQIPSLVKKSPGVGHGNPLQYPCLSHRQRSLVGYSPWAKKSWTQVSAGTRAGARTHTHTQTANPQQSLRLFPLASLLECRVIDSISSQLT